ncbi:MAG: 50S ribosomal protein L5 [Acholeplasmatales bacterium]|jgi:large subunit ribosomal protein L5|nr:50S ribosomal protein L5 [Acholeplasmatales bacterium]
MSRFKELYKNTITPALIKEFSYSSVMAVPKLEKIVVNVGAGEAITDAKIIDVFAEEIKTLTGQTPIITKAKKSISNFKLREGVSIGVKVTLRGEKMYYFLEKLIVMALPRVRDFRGVNQNSFDGRGNYTLGIREQIIFPEVVFDKIRKIKGMDIVIVTTAKSDKEAKALLQGFGMPFRK